MINRVLIRIKVVQLLYSYLLNKTDFSIAPPPTDNSLDSRYAYSLYLDLLLLVIELSGRDVKAGKFGWLSAIECDPKLSSSKLIKVLIANEQIKNLVAREASNVARFDGVLQVLIDKIAKSTIFSDYKKKSSITIKDDAQLWNVLISTVIARDSSVLAVAQTIDGFTHKGYERAMAMAAATIDGITENRSAEEDAKNALAKSFDKAYELYHMLLRLSIDITGMQADRLENAKLKFLPTPDDLNPDMRFVDNAFVEAMSVNEGLTEFLGQNSAGWLDEDDVMVRHLLDKILESELYAEYMAAPTTSFEEDCEFWRKVYKKIILPSDDLAEALENRSVYWNDDLEIMGTFVLKTIKRLAASPEHTVKLLPKFKDKVDERFGNELLQDAITNYDKYRGYVEQFISADWDIERIAFIDAVILVVAIAEIVGFPEIPVPVTVNEYVEIANSYSTRKSGQFVNGMLSAIIGKLHEEGLSKK